MASRARTGQPALPSLTRRQMLKTAVAAPATAIVLTKAPPAAAAAPCYATRCEEVVQA